MQLGSVASRFSISNIRRFPTNLLLSTDNLSLFCNFAFLDFFLYSFVGQPYHIRAEDNYIVEDKK